jgi:hypothetical protein
MTGHKQIEQSLKRPDSFQDKILKALQFMSTHKLQIAKWFSPIIAVAVVGYGFYSWQKHQSAERRRELAKIVALQTEEQMSVSKKREEIQKQIDALRSSKPSEGAKKPEISAENLAKITVLESQISDLKPDNSKSTVALKKFYDEHKNEAEGWVAGLTWSSRLLREDKGSEARPIVEAIAKASMANKFYQLTSRFMLVGILEDAGDFDAALKECDILAGIATEDAKPTILLAKGRLQYFKKSYAESRNVLTEILDKHASSPEATKARSLMAAMGSAS